MWISPLPQSERLAQILRGYGATVTFQKQPSGHQLISADLVGAQQWIQQELTQIKRTTP